MSTQDRRGGSKRITGTYVEAWMIYFIQIITLCLCKKKRSFVAKIFIDVATRYYAATPAFNLTLVKLYIECSFTLIIRNTLISNIWRLKWRAFVCQKLAKRIKFSFHLITWLSLSRCATDVHSHNENRKMKVKGYLEYVSENIFNLISKYCYFCGRDVKMTLFLWRLFIVFMREFYFSWKWWKYFSRNGMKMKWLMLAMSACA